MSIKPWVSKKTLINDTIGPAYYNTALSPEGANVTTNAKLTIYLRVLMLANPIPAAITSEVPDPADATKKIKKKFVLVPDPNSKTTVRSVEVQDWTIPSFEFFKAMVKASAEQFWDNTKLCLITPPDYRGLDYPAVNPTHQLNVDCRFEIVWAKGISDAHIVLWGTCLSGAGATDVFALPSSAGSGWGMLDTGDLFTRSVMSSELGVAGANVEVGKSNAIWHEFGHAIGLPHIGVSSRHQPCLKGIATTLQGGNFSQCYLGPTQDESLNVMGLGDKISTRNSLPWLLRAPEHTNTHILDWKVSPTIRPPRKL